MYIWGETPQEIQKIKTQEHPKYINEEDLKKLKLKLGVDIIPHDFMPKFQANGKRWRCLINDQERVKYPKRFSTLHVRKPSQIFASLDGSKFLLMNKSIVGGRANGVLPPKWGDVLKATKEKEKEWHKYNIFY